MKQNRASAFIILLLVVLGLSACSSHDKKIDGKYVSIYDKSCYLIFDKDGSFKNSLWNITSNGYTKINDDFVYTIDENNIITAIDTTEYEGKDSLNEYEIVILYNNYICIPWNGTLSQAYEDATITNTIRDLLLTFNLKKDKSYEYTITSNNEIVNTENGTYTINGNEVVCISKEGITITFINTDEKVFSIEYVKE